MKNEEKFSEAFVRANKERRFGAPNGNRRGEPNPSLAGTMRQLYIWFTKATAEEVKAVVNDESQPLVKRNFLAKFMKEASVDDFFKFTNQIEGMPTQPISTEEPPTININISADGNKPDE